MRATIENWPCIIKLDFQISDWLAKMPGIIEIDSQKTKSPTFMLINCVCDKPTSKCNCKNGNSPSTSRENKMQLKQIIEMENVKKIFAPKRKANKLVPAQLRHELWPQFPWPIFEASCLSRIFNKAISHNKSKTKIHSKESRLCRAKINHHLVLPHGEQQSFLGYGFSSGSWLCPASDFVSIRPSLVFRAQVE